MNRIKRLLEIPYNFDKQLIDFLVSYTRDKDIVSCIYIAPYYSDYLSAKHIYANGIDHVQIGTPPLSREEYESHIEYINKYFPGKVMLLLQNPTEKMSDDMLHHYINLGISKFCVGNIDVAKQLKSINKNFYIVGSIALKVTYKELMTNKNLIGAFDAFVLFFPYNRKLELVKHLPKCFDYILLVNCFCSIYCDGTHHWFAKTLEEDMAATAKCPIQTKNTTFSDIMTIRPTDLQIWEDYIAAYKLQGRGYHTDTLMRDIILYSSNIEELHMYRYNYKLHEEEYNSAFTEDDLKI